ncbi:MAG: helix-hairpin-helix domain-containing protein [Candidatus Omnitrophica bacterium]|nr:helix-hairpin-helix domain-containing protein [Candidatus Omnitrophota bacterium]
MLALTPTERKVFVFIGILIFCGAILRFFSVKINNANAVTSNISQASKAILISLNTADAPELEKIPGVGPAIANRIIEYRAAYGRFLSLDDLKKVKGIGDKKFNLMKDHIVL